MPVYNRREFAAAAVESVLGQAFGDFEFVIIDDGSTDGVTEDLRRYAAKDERIVLIEQQNTGYTRALNRGLEAVRGEFIARMDSDDVCLPQRFALQVAFLQAHPEVVAVGGQGIAIDEQGDPVYPLTMGDESDAIEARLTGRDPESSGGLLHPAVMMRTAAVRQVGGYRCEFEPAEDRDLWVRLSEVGRLANVPEVVLHYRIHSGSVSAQRAPQAREQVRRAMLSGFERRGEEPPAHLLTWNMIGDPPDDTPAQYERWALSAARHGYYRTARKYALRSLAASPLRRNAWKALVLSFLGRELTSGLKSPRTRLKARDAARPRRGMARG